MDKNELALIDAPFTYTTLQAIISTSFVPKGLRGDTMSALACILYGRELGLGPMQAMRYIDVIDGKPSPTGEYMVSRIFAAGHVIITETQTDESCTVLGHRYSDGVLVAESSFTFTIEMAQRAGLTGKNNWKKYPEAMLYWRAVAQLARQFFPDVIGGLSHLAEELGSEDWVEAPTVVDAEELGDHVGGITNEGVGHVTPDLPDTAYPPGAEPIEVNRTDADIVIEPNADTGIGPHRQVKARVADAGYQSEETPVELEPAVVVDTTADWNLLLATLEVLPTSKDTAEAWRAYATQMTDLMVRTGCWRQPKEGLSKGLLKDQLVEKVTSAHVAAVKKAAQNAPF